ncbi:hypothetical protein V8J88_07740 [Massilia sp. W12]|uniref:hypothetical protein n=1 Tax=Massilia sp. W12 TaxID=3126507 RepID=UPI0030CBDF06
MQNIQAAPFCVQTTLLHGGQAFDATPIGDVGLQFGDVAQVFNKAIFMHLIALQLAQIFFLNLCFAILHHAPDMGALVLGGQHRAGPVGLLHHAQ